jgi:hypothetical protein
MQVRISFSRLMARSLFSLAFASSIDWSIDIRSMMLRKACSTALVSSAVELQAILREVYNRGQCRAMIDLPGVLLHDLLVFLLLLFIFAIVAVQAQRAGVIEDSHYQQGLCRTEDSRR